MENDCFLRNLNSMLGNGGKISLIYSFLTGKQIDTKFFNLLNHVYLNEYCALWKIFFGGIFLKNAFFGIILLGIILLFFSGCTASPDSTAISLANEKITAKYSQMKTLHYKANIKVTYDGSGGYHSSQEGFSGYYLKKPDKMYSYDRWVGGDSMTPQGTICNGVDYYRVYYYNSTYD